MNNKNAAGCTSIICLHPVLYRLDSQVGVIGVEDRDSGRNSEITCKLRDHASLARFELRRGTESPLSGGGRQQQYELFARVRSAPFLTLCY